jgi:hypothetical protein
MNHVKYQNNSYGSTENEKCLIEQKRRKTKIKKEMAILMLAAVIALFSAGTALAQAGGKVSAKFLVEGRITSIGAYWITVQVWDGEGAAHGYIGRELTLQTANDTIYLDCTSGCVPIRFNDLKVGDIIDPAKGRLNGDVFKTKRVQLDNDL